MRVPSFFANKAPKFVLDNLSTYEIAPQLSFLVLLMMMAMMLVMMLMIMMVMLIMITIKVMNVEEINFT